MTDPDTSRKGDVEPDSGPAGGVPPEALEPSGRSEESLPRTAPNPARRDLEEDGSDASTELPPVGT